MSPLRLCRLAFVCLLCALRVGAARAQDAVSMTIFVDADSLTLYIPGNQVVSVHDLGFEIRVGDVVQTYTLRQYPAFGIPLDRVLAPVCFRFVRDGASPVLPLACQQPVPTLIQPLAPADVFWHDSAANLTRTFQVVQGVNPIGICPAGQAQCAVVYIPPTAVPMPTATETPTLAPTPEATLTPTATETPTLPVTPEATFTPTATFAPAATPTFAPVTSNAWTPIIQTDAFGVEMALVPPGCFMMGSEEGTDDEKPVHQQCFDASFWIDRTEVTNAQYRRCVDAGACTPPQDRASYDDPAFTDHPVVYVDWFQANNYASWRGGRLPTEAEWEYAARGPEGWIYPWGNTFDGTRLNFCDANCGYDWRDASVDDGYAITAPVGSYPSGASWVGALDLSGNVLEWTSSLYHPYPYTAVYGDISKYITTRVLRGGAFDFTQHDSRCAFRFVSYPFYVTYSVGFRVMWASSITGS